MNVKQLTEIATTGKAITMPSEIALMLVKIATAANNHEVARKEFERTRAGCVGVLGIGRGLESVQYKAADKKLYDAEMALTGTLIYAKVEGLFVNQKRKFEVAQQ